MRLLLVSVLSVLASPILLAQAPTGDWTTIDDNTEKPRSIIRIAERDGRLYGTVVELIDPDEPDPVCEKCSGDKRDRPILGMEILWGMERDGEEWSGGRILDPENGKTYRCKLWLEDNALRVRGYLGPFYRTQTWYRNDALPAD